MRNAAIPIAVFLKAVGLVVVGQFAPGVARRISMAGDSAPPMSWFNPARTDLGPQPWYSLAPFTASLVNKSGRHFTEEDTCP